MKVPVWLLLAWLGGIATAILARWIVCIAMRYRARKNARETVEAYRRMVNADRPLGELERRRVLREFNALHANAEIVELGRAEPQIRTVSRWKNAP